MKFYKKELPTAAVKNLICMGVASHFLFIGAAFGFIMGRFSAAVNNSFSLVEFREEKTGETIKDFYYRLCELPAVTVAVMTVLSFLALLIYHDEGVRLAIYRIFLFVEQVLALTTATSYFLYFYETFEKESYKSFIFWEILLFYLIIVAAVFYSLVNTFSRRIRGDYYI